MTLPIEIVEEAQLREPLLLAAWPGMGHVALKAFVFLHEALRARHLAVVEQPDFFQLPGIVIQNGLIRPSMLPRSGFYYWQAETTGRDLIFFIGDQQPVPGKEFQLAEAVLNFASNYGVELVITAAAMPTSINHYQPSKVWVAATHEEQLTELSPYCHRALTEGQVSGMNGLLLGVAKQRGMRGFCLLGEIPYYTSQIENPKASMTVLQVLTKVLNLYVDLHELAEQASHTEKEIDRYLLELQQREKEEEKQTNETEGPETVH